MGFKNSEKLHARLLQPRGYFVDSNRESVKGSSSSCIRLFSFPFFESKSSIHIKKTFCPCVVMRIFVSERAMDGLPLAASGLSHLKILRFILYFLSRVHPFLARISRKPPVRLHYKCGNSFVDLFYS